MVYCGMAVHCRCGAAVSFAVITAAKSARLLGVLRNPRTVIHYVRGMLCLAVRSICMNTFLTTSTSVPWRDSFTDDSIGSDVRTGRTLISNWHQPFRDFLFQLIYGRLTKRKKELNTSGSLYRQSGRSMHAPLHPPMGVCV